jgi:hypothetical protein
MFERSIVAFRASAVSKTCAPKATSSVEAIKNQQTMGRAVPVGRQGPDKETETRDARLRPTRRPFEKSAVGLSSLNGEAVVLNVKQIELVNGGKHAAVVLSCRISPRALAIVTVFLNMPQAAVTRTSSGLMIALSWSRAIAALRTIAVLLPAQPRILDASSKRMTQANNEPATGDAIRNALSRSNLL